MRNPADAARLHPVLTPHPCYQLGFPKPLATAGEWVNLMLWMLWRLTCFGPDFWLRSALFAPEIGFVLGSFFAQKDAKSFFFNTFLGSFPLFSIFFLFSTRFPPPPRRSANPFPRWLAGSLIPQQE